MNTKQLAVLTLLLGLVACGGGGDDDGATQQLRAQGATLQAVNADTGAPITLELREFDAVTLGVEAGASDATR